MKLDLKVLKNVLIIEGEEDEINEWVKNNIGEGEVSIREWLDEFDKYWSEWSDDYGDSSEIESILIEDYKLDKDDVDKVMMVYWGCDSIEEYRENYK
jgi:hypothetical protein